MIPARAVTRPPCSSRIAHSQVAVDESIGEVAVHWISRFKVGPGVPEVELGGTNYHGLGVRFRQDLDPLATHLIAGKQPDLGGTKQDVSPAAWGAVTFAAPGKPATIAVFPSRGTPAEPRASSR